MLHDRLMFFKLAAVTLLLSLASTANAEWKSTVYYQGNNVGMASTLQWGGPLGRATKQFPRGSGNLYEVANWCFGVPVARDCNGDGVPEDTTAPLSRGSEHSTPNRVTLEALDQLTAFHAAGERMSEASARISFNRVWTSLDADDLSDWPAEFREGRTSSGAPILHGAETVVSMHGDAFGEDGNPTGVSMEWRVHLLNFAESNNMVYFHVFFRNMSEYLKWSFAEDMAAKFAGTPNGQVWAGMELAYTQANPVNIGSNDEGWAIHNPTGTLAIVDRDGVEGSFSGGRVANLATTFFRNPTWNGQEMKLNNAMYHQWTTEFGFSIPIEVLEGGKPRGQAYLYGLGKNNPYGPFYASYGPAANPWTGGYLYGWPGVLDPGDSRYNQWIWGRNAGSNYYNFFSEFQNFAPRDSFSIDGAVMFVYPATTPFSLPPNNISEIDNPDVQTQLAPMLAHAQVAKIVFEGGYVLPETPTPPPLTIIPGDKEVTITWSDINVHTPDAYYAFLQANPALDPNHIYREYDFEGYRLYRSYVGPSDSHSQMIYTCSISAGDLAFYYKDTRDKDTQYYRMNNGMRVWYALVPYDRNYDPSSGALLSLPDPSSGKVWNRPGQQLYTVEPRSNASNFKAASLGSFQFVPSSGTTAVDARTVALQGDGTGKLVDPPVFMTPPVKSVEIIPINSERISSDKNISVSCTEVGWWGGGCNGLTGSSTLNVVEGNLSGMPLELQGAGDDVQTLTFNGPVDADGVNYAVQMVFEFMSANRSHNGLYYYLDAGGYTGGSIEAARGGCGGRDVGRSIGAAAFTRTGQYRVEWKAAADGGLTVEVKNLTHNVTVPFAPLFDKNYGTGWGFWTAEGYGGPIADGDWENGRYYGEWTDGMADEDRLKQLETLPADNTQQFALWLNGIVWKVSDVTAMPAPGTVWIITNAYGEWNGDQTVFTQHGDMPTLGDKFQIQIKSSTMNTDDVDLSKIMVVPNPYMASSFLDLSPDSRRIDFVNLPDRCTIRIYSLGGHLVNVLNHIGTNRHGWGNYTDWDRLDANGNPKVLTGYDNHGGNESWNLRNRFGQTVASGLYFFHVTDSRGKTYTGKFYIIN